MSMFIQPNMAQLMEVLEERRNDVQQPILFLGQGVAKAAGVPSVEDMAKDLFPNISQPYQEPQEALEVFFNYWETLSPLERQSMLLRYFSHVPVPAFYHDLVNLLFNRHFPVILSTSIDTLLEQAFNDNARERTTNGVELAVISIASLSDNQSLNRAGSDGSDIIRLIKLHGDISQDVALTAEDIDEELGRQQRALKGEFLAGEIIMVGYDFESNPINKWLSWTHGELWWVSPEQPSDDDIEAIAASHRINYINGADAEPSEFFGVLRLGLEPTDPDTVSDPQSRAVKEADIEQDYLRVQLQQHQGRKRKLVQKSKYYSVTDSETEVQIEYESDEIKKIERRLAELTNTEEYS